MQTLFLDANLYATPQDLHKALQRMLQLPDYYGMNADALNDCLSERKEQVNLVLYTPGQGEVQHTAEIVCQVIEDLGGTVTKA